MTLALTKTTKRPDLHRRHDGDASAPLHSAPSPTISALLQHPIQLQQRTNLPNAAPLNTLSLSPVTDSLDQITPRRSQIPITAQRRTTDHIDNPAVSSLEAYQTPAP